MILAKLSAAVRLLDRLSLRSFVTLSAAILLLTQLAALAIAAESHVVVQKNRAFAIKELDVTAGDTVQFQNDDEFIHQVYVSSADFSVDTPEQSPGETTPVKFTIRGNFEVRCHIHPRMLLLINVK